MNLLSLLFNPAIVGVSALFLAVLWMLHEERDKTRPLLVFAIALNLLFGFLTTILMAREGGLFPWKYDIVLFRIDEALGVSAAAIAYPLQGFWRIPLVVVYQLMVPMMISWFLITKYRNHCGSVVLAYVAEMIAGPLMYAILPSCGPIYSFGAQWLHPQVIYVGAIRLSGMPNAFPSLHVGTAFVFVLFAPGKVWRGVSLVFLTATGLATLSTGEHYVIDLVSGFVFGCFAANVGHRRFPAAFFYLGVVLLWSLAIRYEYSFLLDYPGLLRSFAALTVALAILAVFKEWRIPVSPATLPTTQLAG